MIDRKFWLLYLSIKVICSSLYLNNDISAPICFVINEFTSKLPKIWTYWYSSDSGMVIIIASVGSLICGVVLITYSWPYLCLIYRCFTINAIYCRWGNHSIYILHVVVRPDFKGDFLIAQIYTNRERIHKTSRYVIKTE